MKNLLKLSQNLQQQGKNTKNQEIYPSWFISLIANNDLKPNLLSEEIILANNNTNLFFITINIQKLQKKKKKSKTSILEVPQEAYVRPHLFEVYVCNIGKPFLRACVQPPPPRPHPLFPSPISPVGVGRESSLPCNLSNLGLLTRLTHRVNTEKLRLLKTPQSDCQPSSSLKACPKAMTADLTRWHDQEENSALRSLHEVMG